MRVRTNEAAVLEPTGGGDWKVIDAALRTIAQRRGALDALEAKWIREALRVKIWREVGCVTMADYLERRLGYASRTAHDRVRVAVALEELPKLAAALEAGFPHSAVRALTRVCTNDNEQKWLDGVRGKSVHEIENMVAGRARGSDPEDPPNPNLVEKTLPFEGVRPATEALVRDARRALQEERANGEVMSDDDVLASFARSVLERGTGERTVAPYQIAVGLCERCGCGWQESGGRKFALSKADTERACCDAQWIGRVDGGAPERATQDVPPSVRRMVHRRARGRCEMPGCRSTRCLEIHHIIARSLGGTHDPENLILLCDGCHAAHHRGLIAIRGTASELIIGRKHEITYDMVANDETGPSTNDPSESIEPSAHVSTNPRHENDGDCTHPDACLVAPKVLDASVHVSTNPRHDRDEDWTRAGTAFPNPEETVFDPSAHMSTNVRHDRDEEWTRTGSVPPNRSAIVLDPSAHVSTNARHDRDEEWTGAGSASPNPAATIFDPSAHVSTNVFKDRDEDEEAGSPPLPTKSVTNATEPSDHAHTSPSVPSRFERERIRSQARMALTTLGYRSGEAGKAVDLAIRNGYDTLERVIREALRSCLPSS